MKKQADWKPYAGQYRKAFYDVETNLGGTWMQCWPNDGDFFGPGNIQIDGASVVRFRLSAGQDSK